MNTLESLFELVAMGALVIALAAIVAGIALPCLPALGAGCVALVTLAMATCAV